MEVPAQHSGDNAQQVAGKAGVDLARETSECHLLVVIVEATGERRGVLICPGCYITKYHRLINNRHVFLTALQWESEIRVPAWWVPVRTLFQVADFLLHPSVAGSREKKYAVS